MPFLLSTDSDNVLPIDNDVILSDLRFPKYNCLPDRSADLEMETNSLVDFATWQVNLKRIMRNVDWLLLQVDNMPAGSSISYIFYRMSVQASQPSYTTYSWLCSSSCWVKASRSISLSGLSFIQNVTTRHTLSWPWDGVSRLI